MPCESDDWKQVTYRDYCTALKGHLKTGLPTATWTKWDHFAREFLLHLEIELYSPIMEAADVEFVDMHLKEITEVKNLTSRYHDFIVDDLTKRLSQAGVPGLKVREEESWFLIDAENRNEWEFGLIAPDHSGVTVFEVRVWRKLPGDEHKLRITRPLAGYEFIEIDGGENSVWMRRFAARPAAVDDLCRLMVQSFPVSPKNS